MIIKEIELNESVLEQLIRMSQIWEKEDSCYGYRSNTKEDIEGNRIFIAEENGEIIAYLFGHSAKSQNQSSIIPDGADCFEVMEIYVLPEYRNQGIGTKLFAFMEECISDEYVTLSTATKNWKAILHFYVEEAGMRVHSTRLFKTRQ